MAVEDIGDHLYRAASGRSPHTPEGRALADNEYHPSMLRVMKDQLGGVAPLARFLGVARTTVQRWFGGAGKGGRPAQPTEPSQQLILLGMRALRGRRSLARLRAAGSITIEGHDRYDDRPRTIKLDRRHLAPGWQDRMVNGYLTGGAPGIRAAFLGSITDRWYRDHFSTDDPQDGIDVTGVKW